MSSQPVRRLRIAHIVSSLKGGGMEHFVVRLATAQRARGHDAVVLALRDGALKANCVASGVPFTILGDSNVLLRASRGVWYFARLKPDIAHAHNPTALQYAVLGKHAGGARVVMTDHAQTRGIVRRPSAWEVAHTDAIAAVSEATLREASVVGGSALRFVIHNGIELPAMPRHRSLVRCELGLAEDEPTGILVAGMDPVKGHLYLLEAIARLRGRGVRMTALIVGDGAERLRIETRAAQLGLGADAIRFLGYRADVGDLLGASDFLVLPSMNEGLPMCILEAMAHALPVVATAVGGTPELMEHERTGMLVAPRDADALAAAMERLIASPWLRREYGEAARRRVADEFSFSRMVAKYDDVYRQVIGAFGAAGRRPRGVPLPDARQPVA